MSERTFHLQVSSGLASRMRAVVGALAYCQATDRRLIVDWPRKEPSETLGTFDAKFSDLWSNYIEETDCGQRFQSLQVVNADILDNAPDQMKVRTCHIEPFLKWMPNGSYPRIFVEMLWCSDEVGECDRIMLRWLVETYGVNLKTVGVNVRHALKQPSAADPVWFIERMRRFPDDTLFICSFDSLHVEVMLRKEFGERIVCQRKDYRYDRAGIIKTCADLYLLAGCRYVIGSNYSSYSQMVAFMRGAQYVGPHDKPQRGLIGGNYEDAWNPLEEA